MVSPLRRWLPCLPGCLLLVLGAPPARAVPLPPLLLQAAPRLPEVDRALRQLEEGAFEEAARTLQQGLAYPDLTDEQLVELYRVLGLTQLYLGNEARAREAYERLLQAQPDYELPPTEAPKIRAIYARIKEDIKKRRVRPVTLRMSPLPDTPGGQTVRLEVDIEDLSLGSKPKLYFRRAGRQAFSSVDFQREAEAPTRYTALIPAYEVPQGPERYEVEYYVEIADAAQRRLAGRGDALSPLLLAVVPPGSVATAQATPWYQSPWLYVAGGVVLAGATAGVLVATSQPQTGTVPLRITVLP